MSFTMLPGGGMTNPFNPFRPSTGYSEEDHQSTEEVLQKSSATELASNPINRDNYVDEMLNRANKGDEAALEWIINYYASEDSAKTARDWTASREDNAYQRLMADFQKAGISPYVLSGATPGISSSAGKSYSGSGITSRANNQDSNTTKGVTASLAAMLALFGVILKLAAL